MTGNVQEDDKEGFLQGAAGIAARCSLVIQFCFTPVLLEISRRRRLSDSSEESMHKIELIETQSNVWTRGEREENLNKMISVLLVII